jgi:hypothetical protein
MGGKLVAFTIPTSKAPPPDDSGGKLILQVAGGAAGDSHKVGVHIQSFNPAPIGSGSTLDYNYTAAPTSFLGITWTGSEAHVGDTAAALANVLKVFYDNTFTITAAALYTRNTATHELEEVFPPPALTPVAGTSTTFHVGASDAARVTASIYTAKTLGGRRMRLILPEAAARSPINAAKGVTATAGGIDTAIDRALVAYLSGNVTRVVGHNGGIAVPPFTIHVTAMARLRTPFN